MINRYQTVQIFLNHFLAVVKCDLISFVNDQPLWNRSDFPEPFCSGCQVRLVKCDLIRSWRINRWIIGQIFLNDFLSVVNRERSTAELSVKFFSTISCRLSIVKDQPLNYRSNFPQRFPVGCQSWTINRWIIGQVFLNDFLSVVNRDQPLTYRSKFPHQFRGGQTAEKPFTFSSTIFRR